MPGSGRCVGRAGRRKTFEEERHGLNVKDRRTRAQGKSKTQKNNERKQTGTESAKARMDRGGPRSSKDDYKEFDNLGWLKKFKNLVEIKRDSAGSLKKKMSRFLGFKEG